MAKAARWYSAHGVPVFPLHSAPGGVCSCGDLECQNPGKHPRTAHGFKDATQDQNRITAWWKRWPAANIGVPTGAPSDLLVVDCDPRNGGPADRSELIERCGPIPDTAEATTGGGGRHLFFRYSGGAVPKALAPGIDLKGDGGYVVVAPSIHASGNAYQWDGIAGAKALLNPADAPAWLLEYIAAARDGSRPESKPAPGSEKVPKGKRNAHLASLAGTMRKRGMSREAIEAALLEENRLRCDPPLSDAEVRRVAASIASYRPGDDDMARRAVGVLDWPKPEPIQGELPPVVAFSGGLLPVSFRPLVRDVTERMQVPMDYPAVVMVLCLAGAVNRRATIQPKAHDTGWVVVPNLWGGIIAPPGFMKSPVIQAACRSLIQIQADWLREHESNLAEYSRAIEEWELKKSAWKELSKARLKKGHSLLDRPPDAPREPILRRLIVNDATFEAMHQTMEDNPAGILVIRDELTGWWSQLDRAGREGERAFCLQAWNGDTGHTIDRIGRGTIHVEACCMSMLGGIQPGRLRSYLADALKDGPSNDGLIQRFQLLVWPDTEPDWEYIDRAPDPASEAMAARVFRKLVQWDTEGPMRYRFAADAQGLFVDWLARLEARVRGEELHPALVSHLSKYRSLMPSLALLFELADRAAVGSPSLEGESGDSDQCACISLEHAEQAVAWCDYLESHARRIYSCITTPQLRAAQAFAEKLKKRQIAPDGFFSCRDVYLKGWSGLDAPELVRMAVEVLQDAGWIRDVDRESGPLGGRPSARYQVNPRVWE
jgi:putative DNA primase/helicase